MQLTRLAGECSDGRTCATKYATDRDTIVIQGNKLTAEDLAEMGLPDGETAVEMSTDAARKLGLL